MSDVSPKQLLQARLVIRLHRAQQRKRIFEAKMAYFQEAMDLWDAIKSQKELDDLGNDPVNLRNDIKKLDEEIERLQEGLEYLST